jgi:hypothetical protein
VVRLQDLLLVESDRWTAVESHICQKRADMGHPPLVTDSDLTTGSDSLIRLLSGLCLAEAIWDLNVTRLAEAKRRPGNGKILDQHSAPDADVWMANSLCEATCFGTYWEDEMPGRRLVATELQVKWSKHPLDEAR